MFYWPQNKNTIFSQKNLASFEYYRHYRHKFGCFDVPLLPFHSILIITIVFDKSPIQSCPFICYRSQVSLVRIQTVLKNSWHKFEIETDNLFWMETISFHSFFFFFHSFLLIITTIVCCLSWYNQSNRKFGKRNIKEMMVRFSPARSFLHYWCFLFHARIIIV